MENLSRRQVVRVLGTGVVAGLAGCETAPAPGDSGAQTTNGGSGDGDSDRASGRGNELPESIGLETVVSGLRAPVDMAFAPGVDRRYVVEQRGVIHVHDNGVRDEPFLDLRDAVTAGGERGLLGLALHPDFASNGRAFVRYSAPPRSGTPADYSHTFVLSEFAADGDGRARRDSERTLLEIPEPQPNHNAGDLLFGPDGYLYLGVGDGGGGGDRGTGHAEDWYDDTAGGNGQDVTDNLLGSVLRIDVDGESDEKAYAVPDTNPLLGRDGLDEHYAWGLRNPRHLSFGPDRHLYATDAGRGSYQEVNVVERGSNHGWNVREGTRCFGTAECPTQTPRGRQLVPPVVEYADGSADVSGGSVVGGSRYAGSVPELDGLYVFADRQADGELFVAAPTERGLWDTAAIDVEGEIEPYVLGFGSDRSGELYVCANTTGEVEEANGSVYRLTRT